MRAPQHVTLDGNPLGHHGARAVLRALNLNATGIHVTLADCTFDMLDVASGAWEPRDPSSVSFSHTGRALELHKV